MEHARPADPSELDLVGELWSDAVAELDGQRGGSLLAGSLTHDDLPADLLAAQQDPDRLVVIGLIDAVPVGFAYARCDRSRHDAVGAIEVIYVQPPARQVGVAEAMVAVVNDWSVERGCVGVDAPALPGSRPAKSFFEDNGFTARLIVMHHPLRTGDVAEHRGNGGG